MRVSWAMALALLACGDDAAREPDGEVQPEVDVEVEVEAEAEVEVEVQAEVEAEVEVPPVTDWQVESGIYRLAGLDPELPSDDLDNLWGLIGEGDFYGLGESIHSSGGFYAAKERIIRYLVTEHGLRVFAMETPRSAARNLDDFIQGGACDADAVSVFGTDGGLPIFGVYVDDNTVALFRWLCEWNVAHTDDRVHFFGFDAQQPALYEHFTDAVLLYDVASEWAPGDAEWELSQETMIVRDNYDAIVFLRDSPPMDAVLW